jgi:glutamate synthase (NADPH/NADH) small chain
MSANEFLTRVNLMRGYQFPEFDTPVKVGKKVAVIGAGNVAMDSARCSLRLQSLRSKAQGGVSGQEVHIVYRRSPAEVPARREEVHHAEEEGVIFDFLTNPVEILGDDKGVVRAMRCIRMELGEPDQSGRRSPVAIKGSEFDMEVDQVIMALGTSPNPLVFINADGLERSKHGTVIANQENGRTTMKGVWAGGDVVTGAATVISAMGAGKRAAADIDSYLKDESKW